VVMNVNGSLRVLVRLLHLNLGIEAYKDNRHNRED
jgi:hypothetical protein